jgi:hypothetical protein
MEFGNWQSGNNAKKGRKKAVNNGLIYLFFYSCLLLQENKLKKHKSCLRYRSTIHQAHEIYLGKWKNCMHIYMYVIVVMVKKNLSFDDEL